ncbi:hypothetical protein EYM_04880 [Ignicoccus islandicus DSM 13165]|uniref:Isopentenyl phosphate kinase n=1 Tax=Ignicoccus islandicus DSM 13165 TaxID=940295 RepID=A0A0U3FSQ1_9CREN|nr:isopentenyl phosphate kinase [Ignicoccus islandicus]ALU12528.1 hypothetical protein EYM_04880 [Ignicoccus islandicus DSM 13165]
MLVVLKIGGSVISNKNEPYSLRADYLRKLGPILREFVRKGNSLVVIHGGGSFGHPKVKEILEKGSDLRREGWDVVNLMLEMSLRVARELGENFVVHSSSSIWCSSGPFVRPILDSLRLGWIPILQGNVVYPGRVLSGDEIAVALARELRADYLLFATDVDGVYDEWPQGKPLKYVKACEVSAKESDSIDVTGGMKKKLEEINKLPPTICARIFNGLVPENVEKALYGEDVGTLVCPC